MINQLFHRLLYDKPVIPFLFQLISQYEESSDIEEDLSVSTDGVSSRKRTRYVVLYKCSVKGRHNKIAVLP